MKPLEAGERVMWHHRPHNEQHTMYAVECVVIEVRERVAKVRVETTGQEKWARLTHLFRIARP